MCGGGGGDPGAEARRQEEERQRRIKAAEAEINAIFSNQVKKTRVIPNPNKFEGSGVFARVINEALPDTIEETYWEAGDPANSRHTLYKQQRDAVYDLNKREVDRQAAEAGRQNRFGLARTGLAGGSVDIDSMAELDRRTNEGLMRAGGIAQAAADELEANDEKTRINLISTAQSGIDTGAAAQQALSGLKANANQASGARVGATVGSLFNDLSQAYLFNQQNQGRQSGMQYGNQWFGPTPPSRTYQGS